VVEAAAGLYTLTAPGVRLRIEIYPADVAARWRGRRVTVSGSLSVTFQTGYELALDAVEAAR
jgi:hypothetical protein